MNYIYKIILIYHTVSKQEGLLYNYNCKMMSG